jgi:hypothetical protein
MTTLHLPRRNPKTDQLRYGLLATALSHSPANKVNDLDSIIGGENCFLPLITPDYLVVKFDRNSRRSQRQFADEIIQRRPIPYLAAFTVNLNTQCFLD